MVWLGDLTCWQENELEYLRYEYNLKAEDYVVDVGSYRQEWANEIRKKFGCYVECFDALDNRAAWVFDGELEMGGQFYYTSMYDKGELGPVQKYKCVDIVKYVDREVALMKINIEGGEYELLCHIIWNQMIKNIKYLQVQFHLIDGIDCEKEYKFLAMALGNTHKLQWRYPFCWESWERL